MGQFDTGDTGDLRDTWFFRIQSPDWVIQALLGQIAILATPRVWRQVGTATPDEAAQYFEEVMESIYPAPIYPGMTMVSFRETVPSGWLLCDGSIYERTDYPELYASLDPAFIIDSNQFAVPDLQRKTVYGAGSGWGVGDDVGQEEVTLSDLEMPVHSHVDTGHIHSEGIAVPFVASISAGVPVPVAVAGIGVTGVSSANLTNAGGSLAHDNMSPGLIGKWIIYTGL